MIKNFIDLLERQDIIAILCKHYDLKDRNKISLINSIINNLRKLNHFDKNCDIIGDLYEKSKNQNERKVLGEFFTPKIIVNYILDTIGYKSENILENYRIIDISCGSGSFLIEAVKRVLNRWKKKLNIGSFSKISLDDTMRIIECVQNNIIGMEINIVSVILCQINIYLILFEIIIHVIKYYGVEKLPIFNILNRSALKIDLSEKYDFVVGNPPYLFIRDIPVRQRKIIENLYIETNRGQYDYYQIFMEIGVKLLKNHGYLGYIVPDSLLTLANRRIIRRYLYNNTKIKELYYVGEKFDDPVVSNIIVIVQKENDNLKRERNQISINTMGKDSIQRKIIIQKKIKDWNYDFLIHLDDEDIELLSHLTANNLKMRDIMNFKEYKITLSRGVELGKEGKVIYCKNCKKFQPLPKKDLICSDCHYVLSKNSIEKIIYKTTNKKKQNLKPYIYSIDRFLVKEYRYIDISKKGINYKDLNVYNKRIIIRQISKNNRICATYTDSLSLTSQSFYNLKIFKSPITEFNHYYLLGLINSKLFTYFFIKSFGSYKRLFPRILIEKIKLFPIVIPDHEKEIIIATKISKNVKYLLNTKDMPINNSLKIQDLIDDLVFTLYKIPHHLSEQIRKIIPN